jgi:hypothetical protein
MKLYMHVQRILYNNSGLRIVISPRRTEFNPGPVHVETVDKVTSRQVFLSTWAFSPVSIFPSKLHTQIIEILILSEGGKGEASEPSKATLFRKLWSIG